MAIALKLRRGTTTEHTTFTGEEGEVSIEQPVDGDGDIIYGTASSPWSLRIHDGTTVGGFPVITGENPTITNPTINITSTTSGGTVEIQKDYRTRSIKIAMALGGGDF